MFLQGRGGSTAKNSQEKVFFSKMNKTATFTLPQDPIFSHFSWELGSKKTWAIFLGLGNVTKAT